MTAAVSNAHLRWSEICKTVGFNQKENHCAGRPMVRVSVRTPS